LRLAGAEAAVQASAALLYREAGAAALESGEADVFWARIRDHSAPYFTRAVESLGNGGQRLWRLSLPALVPPLDLPGESLVEWHGGQRWLLSAAAPDVVRAAAAGAGGHAAIFRSQERSSDFLPALPDNLMSVHKSLKQAFDPNSIFNIGRLYSWL
jgi:glycolate oxidase FAD binding subunit